MKITTLLLVLTSLQISATVYSQNTKVNINVKNTSIIEIFNEIERQSEFRIFYKTDMLDLNKRYDLKANEISVSDVLNSILDDSNTSFQLVDKIIVITPVKSGVQQQKISGTVTDAGTGEPLPGVNVVVEGTTLGTVTDANGKFTLDVPSSGAVIVLSSIGYVNERVELAGRSTVDIKLIPDIKSLEEVVVVGYGTQKKVTMTGSVSSIESKQMTNIPVANTANMLAGKLPGLIAVQRGGQPGSDKSEISIRGFGSALVIVDGVEQSFDQIDPNEIESFSILKDASASIYGARAGNGVILVTTKRGKAEKARINISSNYGFQSPTRFPELADAVLYAQLRNEAYLGANPGDVANQPFSNEAIEKYKSGTDPNYPNTDWYKETFRKWSPIAQYNINSSGGSDKMKYFLSLGYLNQDGMARSDAFKFRRYNIRSNVDAQIANNLNISLDLSGRIEDQQAPGGRLQSLLEGVFSAKPTAPAYLPDPTKASAGGGSNPIARSDPFFSGRNRYYNKVFNGTLSAKYNFPFLSGLTAGARFSYLTNDATSKGWSTGFNTYNYDYETKEYTIVNQAAKNTLSQTLNRGNTITSQVSLNYDKSFGKHEIKSLLLAEYISLNRDYMYAYREGFLSTAIDQLYAGSQEVMSNDGNAYEDGRISYIGRLNYAFNQKYLLEGTFRYDASARFLPEKRWGLFPGFLAGWRISEEEFMKSLKFIDNLKIRYSYGEAGNDNTSQYGFLTGYQYSGDYAFGNNPVIYKGISSKGLANRNITWENTTTNNIGLDASFFNGRIYFEFDYFKRKVSGVMATRIASLPSTFGARLPDENINSYNNRGFEFRLGHKNSIGDFNYTIEGNTSWSRGKWIHYEEPVFIDDESRARLQNSGQWMNRFFGYKALGYFNSQEEIDNWPVNQDLNKVKNSTIKPGDIKYLDYNNDGVLDDKDKHVIGRGFTPEIMFGLNFSANFKGFDLSMLWQGATNFNTYFDKEAQVSFYNGENILASFKDHWTPENLNAKYPRLTYGSVANNIHTSTFWLQDATYIRLKNIQLGYTLPKQWLSKANLENVRVFVSGYNLLTFDDVSPFDPEAVGSAWYYPQQKSVSGGISITF